MKQDFKVLWAGSAVQDLESIIAYIAEDSPANAKKILSKINKTVSDLYHSPHRGRFVPELQSQGILLYRTSRCSLEGHVQGFRKYCLGVVSFRFSGRT